MDGLELLVGHLGSMLSTFAELPQETPAGKLSPETTACAGATRQQRQPLCGTQRAPHQVRVAPCVQPAFFLCISSL